jgi:4-diphosphocytidyl-2-C-methyl-D-erythritol kinase
VSFFLTGGTALVTGIGENVLALPLRAEEWPLVIVKPPVAVATGAAYAALDALPGRTPGDATSRWLADPGAPISNDFEQAILPAQPAIAAVFDFFKRAATGYQPLLCGSGSAVFCRVPDEATGQALAERSRAEGLGKAWLARTTT